jgi:hypothetical protein
MREPVHFIPVVTTVMAVVFALAVYRRWTTRRSGPHLLWWAGGIAAYGAGTLTEASVTLLGWNPFLFKAWYITGALLGGAPLAQGTVYLLLKRRTANVLTAIVVPFIVVAAIAVALSPIQYDLVEPHRLTGSVMGWQWTRAFSPFINLYAAIFLIGGAALSAWRFAKHTATRHRFIGNTLIAVGALLPGIGGAATRFGHTEILYITEFFGLSLIWLGYWTITRDRVRAPARASAAAAGAT